MPRSIDWTRWLRKFGSSLRARSVPCVALLYFVAFGSS